LEGTPDPVIDMYGDTTLIFEMLVMVVGFVVLLVVPVTVVMEVGAVGL
jgi:hypothetical protein